MAATDTVQTVYDAFAAGDGGTLSALLADTHWVEARGVPYGGVYHGFGEIAENVFGPIGQDVREFTATPDELLPIGDDRVLGLGTYGGTTDQGPMDIRFAHLWTVADGRVRHFEQFTDTHEWRVATGH
jgi:ketosteroid isomerase-like protein